MLSTVLASVSWVTQNRSNGATPPQSPKGRRARPPGWGQKAWYGTGWGLSLSAIGERDGGSFGFVREGAISQGPTDRLG